MPTADVKGVKLEYEECGNKNNPVMLCIMGLGCQLIDWPEMFYNKLSNQGYRVILFDNRDAGLSSKFTAKGTPNILLQVIMSKIGIRLKVPYTLEDMADDTIGLLDALNIKKAHLVGISMGGMIAQITAAKYKERVSTLTCIISSSGNPRMPGARKDVMQKMLEEPKTDKEEDWFDYFYELFMMTGSPQKDEEALKKRIREGINRSLCPDGTKRQFAAILNNGSRVELLKQVEAPTLSISGFLDPLIPYQTGEDIAKNVKNGRFELIENMGHDIPDHLIPRIVDFIDDHASVRKHEVI